VALVARDIRQQDMIGERSETLLRDSSDFDSGKAVTADRLFPIILGLLPYLKRGTWGIFLYRNQGPALPQISKMREGKCSDVIYIYIHVYMLRCPYISSRCSTCLVSN
jgi:hypothetical protein